MPVTITAKVNGFRRCGIAHPDTATTYPDDHFTKAQLDELQAEPMLVVSLGAPVTGADTAAEKQIAALKAEVRTLNLQAEQLAAENSALKAALSAAEKQTGTAESSAGKPPAAGDRGKKSSAK
ncbi:HI1506-related protein [Morganella morganii]|uniref:HI1506-related protein n=1 Tax=Morganella morganii TaxID=582 RepID=UPI000B3F9B2A|nr:HI1506-related protein [Morganella morganii]OVF56703.1 hypothetical protein B5724_05430 [Morganella morganii]HEI8485886.1 hypothetical protein [Morganella morganii]